MSNTSFYKRSLQLELDSESGLCPSLSMIVLKGIAVYWMPKSGNVLYIDTFPAYFGTGYTKNNMDFTLPYKRADFQGLIDKL